MQRTIYGFLSALMWASILCSMFFLNLKLTGQPVNPKAFFLPAILGGFLGVFLFKWQEKNRLSRERLIHLNGVLRSIRSINRILTREKDPGFLIQKICDTLVENRDYHSVWIALMDPDGNWVTFAQAALGNNFKAIIDSLTEGNALSCCRKVLTQREVVTTHSPPTHCGDCPLASGYRGRGAFSAKLQHDGNNYGMITLSVPKRLLLDPEEKRLVAELSMDIAFGLHAIEVDKQRKAGEKALKKSLQNLRERMKELHCLYRLSQIISRPNLTSTEIMIHTVNLIPPAFKHPKASCARITINGHSCKTDNFTETDWKIEEKIIVNGKAMGVLTVCYIAGERKPDRNPFLLEEKVLVNAVAERLGKYLERSQAKIDLQESEKRFRILVENSLTGISIVQDNKLVYQNKEQERLMGPLPRAHIIGDYEKVHSNDIRKVKRFGKDIMQGKIPSMDVDFRYSPNKDMDNPMWIHCRATNIVYRKEASILFNMMDMTRPKKLEKLLITQDKMASLGRVAAGIAHEIRNPLSGINIYLNTLEKFFDRGESGEKVKIVFQHLQSASRKIESVIRRVMDFSKPNKPNFILADVNAPIEEALKLTATTLRKSGVLLEIALTKDLPKCRMDPHQFEEVVLNIINNAADSMRGVSEGKRIKIVSETLGRHVVIRILDSGPGISIENSDRIFDPFFTTKSDSTGIGLSICHRIITDHGGEINVQTNKWGGSEFQILIPVATPEPQESRPD